MIPLWKETSKNPPTEFGKYIISIRTYNRGSFECVGRYYPDSKSWSDLKGIAIDGTVTHWTNFPGSPNVEML